MNSFSSSAVIGMNNSTIVFGFAAVCGSRYLMLVGPLSVMVPINGVPRLDFLVGIGAPFFWCFMTELPLIPAAFIDFMTSCFSVVLERVSVDGIFFTCVRRKRFVLVYFTDTTVTVSRWVRDRYPRVTDSVEYELSDVSTFYGIVRGTCRRLGLYTPSIEAIDHFLKV